MIQRLFSGVRDVIQMINDYGYQASIPENPENQIESLQRNKEIQKWRRDFYISLALTIPVVMIKYSSYSFRFFFCN